MTDVKELERLRPCGLLETYSTCRHHLGYYNNVCLAATYNALSSLDALDASVYAAIRTVIDKHTILSVLPVNEDKSHPDVYFARLPSIDLRGCVEFRNRKKPAPVDGEADEELDQLVMEQHDRSFKADMGKKPYWRLAVLTSGNDRSNFTAVWVFHHALADGASALLFHDTFLAAMNALESSPDTSPVVDSPITPLPPPFEEQNSMAITWPFFLHAVAKSILPSMFDKRPAKLWTGNGLPMEIKSAPRFNSRTIFFSDATTKGLAQTSRGHGVSVTATIQALLSASIFLHLPAAEFDKVQIDGPIALRPFLKDVPDDQATNAISTYNFTHQRPKSFSGEDDNKAAVLQYFSWNEARAVKSAIQTAVAKKGNDNPVALLRYVSNIHEFVTSNLGKPRKLTAEMSNIGVHKPKSEGQWKIGRMVLSQCANPTDAAFHVNVVTDSDGIASLNVNWCSGAIDEDLLSIIMESLKEAVCALVADAEN